MPGLSTLGMMKLAAALAVGSALLFTGCSLTQPAPAKAYFLLQPATPPHPAASARAGTLKIGLFEVAAPFQGRGLVYRTSDYNYVSDFYNEYLVSPGTMIGESAAAYLGRARPFESTVIDPRLVADYELRGVVTQLYGDVRVRDRPVAVLAIHAYVVANAGRRELLLDRVVEHRVEMRDTSALALVQGLSRALELALADLNRELLKPRW